MKYIILLMVFAVQLASSQIIINEVMFNPVGEEPEWIELYNSSETVVVNDTFRLEDPAREYSFYLDNLHPKCYGIIVKDTNLLKSYRMIKDSAKCIETKMPGLNNDKDSIWLKDKSNNIIDHFYYKGTWSAKGFSLERKFAEFGADNIENIKQSRAEDSASCGRMNSISNAPQDTLPQTDIFEISPNPFSPNSAQGKTLCNISLSISKEFADMKIIIYNMNGEEIRSIVDNRDKSAPGKFTYVFDGMNKQGFALQPGIYPVLIQYQEIATGRTIHYKELIVIGN
jgi:hypothetical protein